MALAPANTNFVTGDILTASQYNTTHNTTVKLALEDNSRVVLPTSNAPTDISNGHWVLGAIAGNYVNFNGVGSINTPSVFLYDLNALEWLVYPLVNTAINTDMSLTVWDQYTYYVAEKDFVYYVNSSSTTDSFTVPFIYKCAAATTPLQSPETHPAKWVRTGVYIDESTIVTLSNNVATLSDNLDNLTIVVDGHTTSIANLVSTDIAINLRIDDIENLISTLGIDQINQTLTTMQGSITSLEGRVTNTESDIQTLDTNLNSLSTTLIGAITTLTSRVGIVESQITPIQDDIVVLEQNINVLSQEFETIKNSYEPVNPNIQEHIARTDVHFTQSNINITKSQITDLGNIVTEEVDPIFTASPSFNVTTDHITTLNNTSGINTGDQDLSNLALSNHVHAEVDITNLDKYTKAETDGFLAVKSNVGHTHTESDIIGLDKYTKQEVNDLIAAAGGNLTEAPIDGKQYARQDGEWKEVIGGSSEIITTDTVEVYNPTRPNDENGYAYYAGNTFVSYVNADSLDPQFQVEAIYRCYSNALIAESPETNPDKWIYQGTKVITANDNTGITVIKTTDDLKAVTGYKDGDSVILLSTGDVYFYNSGLNGGIVPNDNTTGFGCWNIESGSNNIEVAKPLLNTSGAICTLIVGREIIHTLPIGTTTLNVVSSFGAGYTKVEKTLVVFDNTDNTSDVTITWPNNAKEYWTDNKPTYISAGTVIKLEVLVYGSTIAVFNPYFIQSTGTANWSSIYIDSSVTTSFEALPNIIYLIDAQTTGVTAILPNSTSGDSNEYKFILDKDTHKLTITTVGGTQLIGGYTSQIIPTLKGSLELKSNGNGYDVTDDNRNTINVVEITSNRDFGDDNFENNFLYLVKPNGGSIALTIPTATSITGGIAIVSRFQLEGTGDFTITAASGLIGDSNSQTVNVTGTGFDIVWYDSIYYIQNDNRPKTTSATVTTYPMNEDTTIIDSVTGTFFKQRCSTTECPGYNTATATSINTTITAAAGGVYQCTGSSLVAGSMIGSIPVGNIEIYYNVYKTGTVNIEVYVEYYKRTAAGVETSLGISSVGTISSTSLVQLRLVAQHIAFDIVETDYLVVRTFARKATTGTDPILTTTVEGPNATRSTMEIGASSIAHGTLAGRGAANSHPASAIQLASGTNLETYLSSNSPIPDIIASATWDGTAFNIDLSAGDITWKSVNTGVTSLTIGTTFASDASTKGRVAMLIIDNSTNTSAITSITFNGTWYWPLGVQPLGIAAGAIAILQVRNIAGTIVLPTYFIKA